MPNILPQLLSGLARRAYSPPIEMYLRLLLGSGRPMTKLPPALEQNISNLKLTGTNDDGFEDWAISRYGSLDANPHNLGYSDYAVQTPGGETQSPDIGGLRAREMSSQESPLMTMRTLGSFNATPLGRDSVHVRDNYDFDLDTQADQKVSTAPFIRFGQRWGNPYAVDARIAAPKLNAQLRARELSFAAARKRANKDIIESLARVLGSGK